MTRRAAETINTKICKKHPELLGLRYLNGHSCVECVRTRSRVQYSSAVTNDLKVAVRLLKSITILDSDLAEQASQIISRFDARSVSQ